MVLVAIPYHKTPILLLNNSIVQNTNINIIPQLDESSVLIMINTALIIIMINTLDSLIDK